MNLVPVVVTAVAPRIKGVGNVIVDPITAVPVSVSVVPSIGSVLTLDVLRCGSPSEPDPWLKEARVMNKPIKIKRYFFIFVNFRLLLIYRLTIENWSLFNCYMNGRRAKK